MNHFSKTFFLTRFYLRKDWVTLVSWLALMLLMTVGVAAIYPSVYPNLNNRIAIINTLKLPSMRAILGLLQNSTTSISNIFVSELSLWMMLLAGIFAIILANGNTRKQEDNGLLEIMQARCVGRFAPLLATFNELILINGLTTILIGSGLNILNLTGSNGAGNWLFASLIGVAGLLFGSLTILLAQVSNNSSQNLTFTFGFFTLFYLLFVGKMVHPKWPVAWLTPFSVVRKLSIYQHNNFGPILLLFVLGLALFGIGFYLASIRDEGSGLLPSIAGRKTLPFLRNYPMLVLVNQFESSAVWIVLLFIFGAMYGSVLGSIQSIVKGNPLITKILQTQANQAITSFLFVISLVFAVIATVPGILTIYKLRTDEKRGLIELIYARPVTRTTVYLANVLIGMAISVVAFVEFEMGIFLTQQATLKSPLKLSHFISLIWANGLPMLVLLTLATAIIVWLPKFGKAIWGVLYVVILLNYFGSLFKIKHWIIESTMFGLIKRNFSHPLATEQICLMVGVELILLIASWEHYRKIDL
ncbi:hypothetical protein [Fructilactobacillus sanfranciscensis]|uniref:hypothetical protein n=1 Tax=Fructilactobacillus sanfranciscensis TaxID=1625 RepID=UPI0013D00621|nr:hypothetical protein [Fructilactobacillus sanfranciscensis]NDR60320.1 hypothetical protein [Fructilactobacillus sanfranciscensis]